MTLIRIDMKIARHLPEALQRMHRPIMAFALLLLFATNSPTYVQAQQNSDGSVYSRFGIGELYNFSSSQIQALGGGGFGLASLNYVNLANPASFSDQSLTRIGASVQFQGLEIADAQGDASRLNSSQLQAFLFSFPIRSRKLGAALSYTPYTRVAHKVQEDPVSLPSTLQDASSYTLTFEGSGGLQKASMGFGFRPSQNVSLGISADFLFGILTELRRTDINADDPTNSNLFFNTTELNKSTRLSGFTSTLGGLFTIPSVLREQDALSIGFSATLPTTLEGTQTRTLGQSLDQDTLGVSEKGDVELPVRANMGIAYYLNPQWTFLLDLSLEPWSSFDSQLSLPGFTPGGSSSLADRTRFSAGIDFQPSSNVLDSYFRRVGYRIGYYFDTGYVDVVDNANTNAYAFTGGLSLPTLFPGTRIDINAELGRRGTTDLNLVRETFYKIHVSVNIGERWFERRKLG